MATLRAPRKEVEIICNEHMKGMLEHALENDLELLPFLVLGFFCGIRPAGELTQVLWRHVHLDGEKPEVIITRSGAVWAGTIPLRQAAAGCAAQNMDTNQPGVFRVR